MLYFFLLSLHVSIYVYIYIYIYIYSRFGSVIISTEGKTTIRVVNNNTVRKDCNA